MVNRQFTILHAQTNLVKLKQGFVDGKYVVDFVYQKVLDNYVKFAAFGQCKSNGLKQAFGFVKGKFKRNGKAQNGVFAGLVVPFV